MTEICRSVELSRNTHSYSAINTIKKLTCVLDFSHFHWTKFLYIFEFKYFDENCIPVPHG